MCEEAGIPAVAVVTQVFENLARTAAAAKGFGHLRIHVLPHPMESRPEAEVRAIVREQFTTLLGLLAENL